MTDNFFNNLDLTGTEVSWYPSDTEINFKKNLRFKSKAEQLSKLGWTEKSINYKIDSLGFRNDNDFSKEIEYNLVLGCSHSFGIGVNRSDIWFNHTARHFKEPFYNASVAGYGIGSCYRSLQGLLDLGMKIKRVFMLVPEKRYEHFSAKNKNWETIAWWTKGISSEVSKVVLEKNTLDIFYTTNLLAIKYLCNIHNIELVNTLIEEETDFDIVLFSDKTARDLTHPGKDAHKKIGEIMYEKYSKQYSSSH